MNVNTIDLSSDGQSEQPVKRKAVSEMQPKNRSHCWQSHTETYDTTKHNTDAGKGREYPAHTSTSNNRLYLPDAYHDTTEQSIGAGKGREHFEHIGTSDVSSSGCAKAIDAFPPNIVIFGETGVEKSSIINLIANQKLARTSNDAIGCTFQHDRHLIMLEELSYAFWDTVGLDEGSDGTVLAEQAESNLNQLIQELTCSGGIHLVIYCIRCTPPTTTALKRNYDLFYAGVCRKKVPIALVVTGLEYQGDKMETWWASNEAMLRRNGMLFDDHACVTTVTDDDPIIQKRRLESRKLLQEIVVKYTGLPARRTGLFQGMDENHTPQPDDVTNIDQRDSATSGPSHFTTEPALVSEQGKEEFLGIHTEDTVSYDSCSPKNRDQYPPGMYYDDQFPEQDMDDALQPSLGDEQRGLALLDSSKPVPITGQREENVDTYTPNIVIFGETGVGKSSLINLIAGQKLAGTSNDAEGCTFEHKRYRITLGAISFDLWDTTGLDRGSEGTVPAKVAEKNLRELMQELAHSGGIGLIIYCIRGTRLIEALKRNYDLFYVTVCRKKVPVALVVTGLEHQLGEMETWWITNEAALQRHGMQFDAHACVTALDVEDRVIQQRRSDSQKLLRDLVVEYSGRPSWKIDTSLMLRVLPFLRSTFRGASTRSPGNMTAMRKVVVCGSFTGASPVTTIVWPQSIERINNREYEVVPVDKHMLTSRTLEDAGGIASGAGVLVFHTSPLVDHRIPPDDANALKRFYNIAGRRGRCVIIVLQSRDDKDKEEVRARWDDFCSRHSDIQAQLISTPVSLADARANVYELIEDLYTEHVEVKSPGFFKKLIK